MKQENLFIKNYNEENGINIKKDLDLYDECSFSYIDILKEKEVEVTSKVVKTCKCKESVNFNTYYNKCEKCDGIGIININGNEVVCNHCHGEKSIVKNVCPLCNGEGKVIKKDKVKAKLNRLLKEGDFVTIKGAGKESNGVKGNLYIKVKIPDRDYFKIEGNDVYDRRMIDFSKEDIAKNVNKSVETIKGFVKVSSKGEEFSEVVKLDKQGIDDGDYYICLNNELSEIKGEDVYKNIIVKKESLSFYLKEEEINNDDLKYLNVYYFKNLNGEKYNYVELEDVNNFKIIKLKEKGKKGKFGGINGDLYLRVYFEENFKFINNKLQSLPIKLTKYEVNEGKKIIEYNKSKINLVFEKNLKEEKIVEVKEYGFMMDKNSFDSVFFNVNPFPYDIYKVSVKVTKKEKVVYLKNYKNYFYEEVSLFNEGLKVDINKKKEVEVFDGEGNKVLVRIIR